MDRLDAMALFVAAVDEGSLAAAARRHGRSPAAATRAVALLEDTVGETLLRRSTRQIGLTASGERYIAIWRDVLARLADEKETGAGHPLAGTISITAPELFGRLKVVPALGSFLAVHRKISMRVLLLNRVVDLVGEGVDLAIRLATLPDSNLTAVKIGEMRHLVCASPLYLDRAGEPATPAALVGHDCIGLNAAGDRELWPFAAADADSSRIRSVQVHTRTSLNSAAAALDLALLGYGIIRPLSYQIADEIAAGRLIPLLNDFEPPPTPVYVVFHPNPRRGGAARMLIDHLVPVLKAELSRISDIVARQI